MLVAHFIWKKQRGYRHVYIESCRKGMEVIASLENSGREIGTKEKVLIGKS